MIINRDSWHYRLLKKWDCIIPHSLCPYFWKVVVACFMSLIAGVGLGVFLLWWALASLVAPLYLFHSPFVTVSAITVWTINTVLIIFLVRDNRHLIPVNLLKPIRFNRDSHSYTPREPNIFFEYLKAIHNKVCPTLEFK